MTFENLISNCESPGLRTAGGYDIPLTRDKIDNE